MEILSLEVERRAETGKTAVRRLRRMGRVPAVVYGIHEATPLTVDPKVLEKLLSTRAGSNVLIQLNVEGEKKSDRPVIVKDLQRDSMQGAILHADFLEIRMDQKIKISVPISLKGEAPGIKQGGVLSQLMRELDVECLPIAIPEEIAVDINAVNVNDVIHVRDLTLPEGVDLLSDPEEPVLTVIIPAEEEEEKPEEEAVVAEGEAEAAADQAEAAEPAKESKEKKETKEKEEK